MNGTPQHTEDDLAHASREEILAALFANMVIQQTNMAMMLLGKVANPETGKIVQDVEAAKMFIDQLEMLQEKTKGNLSKQEENLLKQALAALHMAFVEAVEPSGAPAGGTPAATGRKEEAAEGHHIVTPHEPTQESAQAKPDEATGAAAPDDSRKRFSKKY